MTSQFIKINNYKNFKKLLYKFKRGDYYVCPVCNNKNKIYIGYKNGEEYCRKCIRVSNSKTVENKMIILDKTIKANINYSLTQTQQKASEEILNYVKNNQSVIVNAVCGAGKTELVYQSIEYIVNQNKKVAFAIPRKDVVIEICNRLKKDYPTLKISAVYGGNTNDLEGQIVVLTTHQLFRYKNYFDLLILDEADAFPYYKDELLNNFLKSSVKGPIVYLSATIKDDYKKECKNIVYVNRRFHNYDLPVPKVIRFNLFNKIVKLKQIIALNLYKQILVFVPTIDIGRKISKITGYNFVYSSLKNKQEIIDMFKEKRIRVLITTSILERGMTFFNVQVIVFDTQHDLFDESSLIQISGRVGRKLKAPTGNVYFLTTKSTPSIQKCIKTIKKKNKAIV